ncbi:ROK family protein [Kitasatospora terrestris]|uniref:ROK family protein n=1 Tax=Kitasatospora terrestris TaxID=258051 RepID=A0ABP9DIG6_9ACTN
MSIAGTPVTEAYVIALDVGGTAMKGAVVGPDLRPVLTLNRPTPVRDGPQAVVEAIREVLADLDTRALTRGIDPVRAGVVVPGIVDEELGEVRFSANLGFEDLPLARRLKGRLPVTVGHDVRAGGLAEAVLGAAAGTRDVAFLAVGTGIAAALISDDHLLTGSGWAGEIGHLSVEQPGPPCACGATGCLEALASASAIAAELSARTGRPVAGAAEVADRLLVGDRHARAVWDRAVEALAIALAALTTVLAPETVVIGGGLAESGELLLDPLQRRLAARLTFQRPPRLVKAALGERAGCIGAALLAQRAMGR